MTQKLRGMFVEHLERREVLTTAFYNLAGTLFVEGNSQPNDITIIANGGFVEVVGVAIVNGPVAVTDLVTLTVTGAGGDDTIDLRGISRTAGFVNLTSIQALGDDTSDTMVGIEGNDLIFGASDIDGVFQLLEGDRGNDTIVGGDSDDVIIGGYRTASETDPTGNDSLVGGVGNDLIYGDDQNGTGAGNDTILGGAGNDTMYGGLGDDWIDGNEGNDFLDGESPAPGPMDVLPLEVGVNNDTLIGGAGDDTLEAGAGEDFVIGSEGNDLLRGGSGDDRYLFSDDWGKDTIEESAGFDTIDFSAASISLAFGSNLSPPVDAPDTLTFETDDIESYVGGSGDDSFNFGPGANFGNGEALLDGGGGTNWLDYTEFGGDATVNLDAGTATGVSSIANIQQVIGATVIGTAAATSNQISFSETAYATSTTSTEKARAEESDEALSAEYDRSHNAHRTPGGGQTPEASITDSIPLETEAMPVDATKEETAPELAAVSETRDDHVH